MLLCNQIKGFFDHQCLRKKTINVLDFLHGNSNQGKIVCKTTTVGWVWSGVANHVQKCLDP